MWGFLLQGGMLAHSVPCESEGMGRTHCTLSSVACFLATSTTRRAAVSVREL